MVNPSRANRLQQNKNVTSDMYLENVEPQMFSSWVENTQMISNVAKAKASPHVAALDLRGNSTNISCQRHLICADGVLRSCSLSCRRACDTQMLKAFSLHGLHLTLEELSAQSWPRLV